MQTIEEIIVIGSGNWGLALACLFSKNLPTRVWTIDKKLSEEINSHRDCPGDFFKYPLPESIIIEEKYSTDFEEDKTIFILAVPSSQVEASARELAEHTKKPLIVTVSKGFDADRQCTMSQLIQQQLPGASVVVLTGPTIANEVAEGKPTRAVLASEDLMHLALVKECLQNDVISFEVSQNPRHHEICAALKGLVAISVGMAEGLDMGTNIQGVLMTEGILEISVVASFFGIPESVAYGISGTGDLITTCISPDSRNRRLGSLLAQGQCLKKAMENVGMTVEGVAMSQTIETLWSLDVSIPLIHMVNRVLLSENKDIHQELKSLVLTL
jgi:glycerol-3-phosphate dehydrogenase (NAD(P)+)